ncbi:WD40-repeat-containing domain protein [Dipodascopsis uninucleata]
MYRSDSSSSSLSSSHGNVQLSTTGSRPMPVNGSAFNRSFNSELPTPAPSPTPLYTANGGSSNHMSPSLFGPLSPPLEVLSYSALLGSLSKDFRNLTRSQKESLLTTLIDACDTTTLSFIHEYVSPLLKKDPFKILPTEICLRILSYIDDPQTLARASQVSKRWYVIVADDMTWKALCERRHYTGMAIDCKQKQSERMPEQIANVANDALLTTTSVIVSSPPTSNSVFTTVPITFSQNDGSMMESTYNPVLVQRIQPTSYRMFFKQRYMVDSAWIHGGRLAARHVTTDQGVVTCLNITKNYIIVALDNSRIHIFTSDGRLSKTLTGHVMGVWAIMPWDDILVSGGCDRDVRVWDMITGDCLKVMHGHTSTVRCLKMSDYKTAISGSRDASLRVWDIEKGVCKHVLLGHHASVRCLEVYGDICVSGSYDTTAKVWNISTGQLLHTLTGHFSQIYALAFDGVKIATGSLDTSVRVWDAESGQCMAVLQGHTSLVGQLQMRNNILVSGSSDGSTRVWDLNLMTCIHRLAAHDNSVTTLQFDEHRIVTGGSDGRVRVWDINTGHHIRDLPCTFEAVWRIAFEGDKVVILASRQNRTHMEVISFSPTLEELESNTSSQLSHSLLNADSSKQQESTGVFPGEIARDYPVTCLSQQLQQQLSMEGESSSSVNTTFIHT